MHQAACHEARRGDAARHDVHVCFMCTTAASQLLLPSGELIAIHATVRDSCDDTSLVAPLGLGKERAPSYVAFPHWSAG